MHSVTAMYMHTVLTGDVMFIVLTALRCCGLQRRLRQLGSRQGQWALSNDPFIRNGTQWHHARIRSQAAWMQTPGDLGKTVRDLFAVCLIA